MKALIKKRLKEGMSNYSFESNDKWSRLEDDVKTAIIPIVEKYKTEFGFDSYAVIDAINQVFNEMFQKVHR